MGTIKEALHEKRTATEDHVRQLQREEKAGVRYTAMMPDIPFLLLGLLSDIGWLTRLAAGSPAVLFRIAAGGLLNFAAGLPIYLSFKKGIFYGVK